MKKYIINVKVNLFACSRSRLNSFCSERTFSLNKKKYRKCAALKVCRTESLPRLVCRTERVPYITFSTVIGKHYECYGKH